MGAPFAPNHIPRAVAQTPAQPVEHGQEPNTSSKPITRSAELNAEAAAARDESWKAEYDRHLSGWRGESAVRREAAEKERGKWEKLKQGQRNPVPVFVGVLSLFPRASINESHAHRYSTYSKSYRCPWSCNGRKGRGPRDRDFQRRSIAKSNQY